MRWIGCAVVWVTLLTGCSLCESKGTTFSPTLFTAPNIGASLRFQAQGDEALFSPALDGLCIQSSFGEDISAAESLFELRRLDDGSLAQLDVETRFVGDPEARDEGSCPYSAMVHRFTDPGQYELTLLRSSLGGAAVNCGSDSCPWQRREAGEVLVFRFELTGEVFDCSLD